MKENKKTLLKCYFWMFLVLTTALAIPMMTFNAKDIAQMFFTYMGFVAVFGYAYNKKYLPSISGRPSLAHSLLGKLDATFL
jgi:hypothetical protein